MKTEQKKPEGFIKFWKRVWTDDWHEFDATQFLSFMAAIVFLMWFIPFLIVFVTWDMNEPLAFLRLTIALLSIVFALLYLPYKFYRNEE